MRAVRLVRVAAYAGAEVEPGLALARRLATGFGGGFSASLIEEAALVDLAALPVGAEIGHVTRRARPADPGTMLAELRRSLGHARRALARLAEELGAPQPSGPVATDPVEPILSAASDEILLCLAPPRRFAEPRLAAAVLTAARTAAAVAVAGGPARSGRVIAFAETGGSAVEPFLARLDAGAVETLPSERLGGGAAAMLAVRRQAGLVVVEAGIGPAARAADLAALLRGAGCPVLVVNPESA
jgi:hypothetical protein